MKQPIQLDQYRQLIDKEIETYSAQLLADVAKTYGPHSQAATQAFTSILARGGKRLRGALVIAAYQMLGGSDLAMATKVARIVEMVQAYLLMTDDIADRSDVRRGGPSAHRYMENYHGQEGFRGDAGHFGVSIAMMSALANIHQAELDLDELQLPDDVKLKLLKSLHLNLIHTLHGQIQDIFIEAVPSPTEADVMQVIKFKTAYYTLINPLEIGALLAGAESTDIQLLQEYGLKAGVAFQLADDVLGVFGEADQSGKSPLDDIKEGKATLLAVRALAKASPAGQQQLRHCLGNPNLTMDDLQQCRDIMTESGALAYVKQMAADHVKDALNDLDRAPKHWNAEQVNFLRELTVYVADRQA